VNNFNIVDAGRDTHGRPATCIDLVLDKYPLLPPESQKNPIVIEMNFQYRRRKKALVNQKDFQLVAYPGSAWSCVMQSREHRSWHLYQQRSNASHLKKWIRVRIESRWHGSGTQPNQIYRTWHNGGNIHIQPIWAKDV